MADFESSLAPWAPQLRSVMRIIVSFLFMAWGMSKFFGYPMPGPPLDALLTTAGVLELGGGLLLLVGLLSRPVAFLLSGEMAVAYFMQHAPKGFWPLVNHGELAALYSFVFLYLAAAGPGPWSLDALFRHKG